MMTHTYIYPSSCILPRAPGPEAEAAAVGFAAAAAAAAEGAGEPAVRT